MNKKDARELVKLCQRKLSVVLSNARSSFKPNVAEENFELEKKKEIHGMLMQLRGLMEHSGMKLNTSNIDYYFPKASDLKAKLGRYIHDSTVVDEIYGNLDWDAMPKHNKTRLQLKKYAEAERKAFDVKLSSIEEQYWKVIAALEQDIMLDGLDAGFKSRIMALLNNIEKIEI